MPIQAIRTVSKAQNGVGAFILQCKRLDFHYCDWAGSSRGMNAFLSNTRPNINNPSLSSFAKQNPGIELSVSPRPGRHPVIKASYMNGRHTAVCVRNMTPKEILERCEALRSASGQKLKDSMRAGRNVVQSRNESVRGVWDGFHGAGKRFRI